MALTSGTKLGPYEIQSLLGAGGMGEVYRGKDTRLDRTVAIKLLPTHLSSEPELRQRLEREARAISALQHANICTLYDIGTQDGTEFLVMEYLEGQTLAERLQKGPLPVDQVLKIAIEIAHALEKAHQRGIIHRDLKPANIMLTKAGAKLMDFGLAKSAVVVGAVSAVGGSATLSTPTLSIATLSEPAEPLTQRGSVLGTLQYMAPEVLQGNEADARSDIFSFGCVLYEMVTGQRAFPGNSQLSVLSSILEKEPDRVTAVQPFTPLSLEYIVHACLAKNPGDRWQDVGDLARNFELVRMAVATRVVKPSWQVRWSYGIAVASALVTVAVLLWATLWQKRAAEPRAPLSRFSFSTASNTRFTDLAVSPDGRQIAYAANSAIWVRSLDSQVSRRLAGTSGERLMFWSADGRSIAFLNGFKLQRISLSDSVVQDICEIRGFSPAGGAWSRNDVILIGSYRGPLMRVSANGGEPVPLKLQKDENGQRWPWFLPDGHHYLYLSASGSFVPSPTNRAIRYSDLDGSSRVVSRENSNAEYAEGNLVYVKDGALVAAPFDAGSGQTRGAPVLLEKNVHFRAGFGRGFFDVGPGVLAYTVAQPEFLAWVDRQGNGPTQIGREGGLTSFDIAPDGKSATVEIANERSGNGELWLLDLQRQVTTRLTTDDAFWNWGPVWSADGKAVYFSSTRSGVSDLYEHLMRNNEERTFLSGTKRLAALDVSRDGKFLLYEDLDPSSAADLWVLPLSGERKPFPFIKTNYMETSARFSPDGHWVAYASNESGNYEIYVQSFPTPGQAIRISTEGGIDPRWRRDGRELYFVSSDGRLMATEVRTEISFSAGVPKPLFRFSGTTQTNRRSYWPSPDGQRFLVMKMSDDSAANIQVTVSWTEALRK
ncbi:MAG: protein kinase domain-containing protein [Acidobacteriota bacterium]